MLTDSQKEILINLNNQFERLNAPNKSKGSLLIDTIDILESYERDAILLQEIKLNNDKWLEIRDKEIKDSCEKLNADLMTIFESKFDIIPQIDFPEIDLQINQVVFQTGSDPWAGAVSVAEKSERREFHSLSASSG